MAKDKEYSTNDEVKRSEDFQKRVDLKENIIEFLKENLISITDSVFQEAGYIKNEKNAGEYGDGSKYGAGAVENQYIVSVAGKTKSVLTKKIIMDGKSISSDIEINYKDNIVEFTYLTTEQGFFRGVDKNKKTYTVNEKFALDSNDMNNLKNELKSKIKDFAKKELGYITNTKIGVADKSNKSTSSVVENKNLNMKKLTIKELFEMDDDNFDSSEDLEMNSDKIKDLNTIDLKDTNPPIDSDKQLFFDEKELNETGEWIDDDEGIAWKESLRGAMEVVESHTNGNMSLIDVKGFDKYQGPYAIVEIDGRKYKIWTINDLFFIENYPVNNTSDKGLNPGFEGTLDDIIDVINGTYDVNTSTTLKTIPGTSFSMNELGSQIDEVTTSGPTISGSEGGYKNGAQSGSGGYNTKNSWKQTPYAKAQQKRPKVTHDYKVVPQNESQNEKEETSSSKLKDTTPKSTGKDIKAEQPSNKNNGVVKPETEDNSNPKYENPNYKNTNQTKAPKSSNDDFWTEVDLIPGSGYVPKGMDKNYVAGMHDRPGDLKKLGLAENKKPDLTKKKFFSLNENKEKGINKRYLITERTTEEYEKDRFKKLSNFKTRESIKEAEEMNNFFDSIQDEKDPQKVFIYKKSLTENISYENLFDEESANSTSEQYNNEQTIEVEKPGSKFGLTYKFFKSDFLNENKAFILDLNSRVYVKNPNSEIKK